MKLESSRLNLQMLSYAQLLQYLQLDFSLEKALELKHYPRTMSVALIEAFHESILPAVADATIELPFVTLWTIIDKASKTMVGDLCFKGMPNEAGEVEIGYGTYPSFEHQGYMTEAVNTICKWALQQPRVMTIIAETSNDNAASHRILLKNNFQQYKQVDKMLWWRLNKTTS
jgi:[ribosomal protein S5]-alanine N-acetyltransferase